MKKVTIELKFTRSKVVPFKVRILLCVNGAMEYEKGVLFRVQMKLLKNWSWHTKYIVINVVDTWQLNSGSLQVLDNRERDMYHNEYLVTT